MVNVPARCDTLDRALATITADLHARDLLKDTFIVLTSEFGRTPTINQNIGRENNPLAAVTPTL